MGKGGRRKGSGRKAKHDSDGNPLIFQVGTSVSESLYNYLKARANYYKSNICEQIRWTIEERKKQDEGQGIEY